MLFSIDEDSGSRIEGWIMPDNPSASPRVAVFLNGEKRHTCEAKILRPLLREQGLHETGICGFVIDRDAIPEIAGSTELELYDEATNIRIYRRRPATARFDSKLFRLETSMVPQSILNEAIQELFHMSFTRLDRIPEEATKSILGIAFTPSIFATGRIHLPTYDALLRDRGFRTCLLARDPVEELAEQLLVLRWATKAAELASTGVLVDNYKPLVQSLAAQGIEEIDAFESWLVGLSALERFPLTNPLTRLLTCRDPDDALEGTSVGSALEAVADMDAAGLRSDVDGFWSMLSLTLEDALPGPPSITPSQKVLELAERLRAWPIVRQLLAADIELFDDLQNVFRRVDEEMVGENALPT